MPDDMRPGAKLHLDGGGLIPGEIPLDALVKVARQTQLLIRQIARSLIVQRDPGRTRQPAEIASMLSLKGVHIGSTVLDLVLPPLPPQEALDYDIPTDIGDLSMNMFVDGFVAVAGHAEVPEMPVGYDRPLIDDMDVWFRGLRQYTSVGVESAIGSHKIEVHTQPKRARERLKRVDAQPTLPWISRTDQSLEGRLYAVNTRTGSWSIEDATGHSIRLRLPEALRTEAATWVNRRVLAVGRPVYTETRRLREFATERIVPAPERDGLPDAAAFYEEHQLIPMPPPDGGLDGWFIDDLTEDESEAWASALAGR